MTHTYRYPTPANSCSFFERLTGPLKAAKYQGILALANWFRGVAGYHTSLTHWWSPVRARAKSLFFSDNILFFPSLRGIYTRYMLVMRCFPELVRCRETHTLRLPTFTKN